MRYLLLICLIFTSCAVTWKGEGKKTKQAPQELTPEQVAAKKAKEAREKFLKDPKNWQHQYYEQAIFKVKNPIIVQNSQKLEAICGGNEAEFKEAYRLHPISEIKYKSFPITIKTKSGFSKKVYVTKGVCRELSLYKRKQSKSMRKRIKMMNLLYVYNVGTYVLDVTFETKFAGVDFFVK